VIAIAVSEFSDGRRFYPVTVRTIEEIRLSNYRRAVAELAEERPDIKAPDIARAFGISTVYAWQLENGKRSAIDSKAARKIEMELGKPVGWMDTDYELWPFDPELLAQIGRLKSDARIEIQGVLRAELARRAAPQKVSGESLSSQSGPSPRAAQS